MESRPHIVFIYIFMVSMIAWGAGNGIATKLTNVSESLGESFKHPFFQTFTMFLGESLWMLVFMYEIYNAKKQYGGYENSPSVIKARAQGKNTNLHPLKLAIPMLLDGVGSTLLLFAYLYIPISVAQMMGGCIVMVTAIMSIIFLKKRLHRHHWTGLALVVTGIALVGLAVMITKNDDEDQKPALGIWLMIGSILIQGAQFVIEEKFFGKYFLSPMRVVGWEGIWGTLVFGTLLIIFQFIPWDFQLCSKTGVIEDSWFALRQAWNNPFTLIMLIWSILFIAGYNGFGVTITKYLSATSRTTLKQTKILLVWVFFLAYQGKGHESFKILQLIGFVILVFGILLYNEIIVLPFLGFDKNITLSAKSVPAKMEIIIDNEENEANKLDTEKAKSHLKSEITKNGSSKHSSNGATKRLLDNNSSDDDCWGSLNKHPK